MRLFVAAVAVVVVVAAAATVHAQPGMTAPGTMGPTQQPPPPGMMVPPPYAYQPTPEEQDILATGYISDGAMIGGGLLALWLGFGIGQGLEGRWHDTGWIFTLGESASFVAVVAGAVELTDCAQRDCQNDSGAVTLLVGGIIAIGGLRIWEIVDAFTGPGDHNNRVRQLRRRYGYPDYARVTPYIARPHGADGGGTAGLTFRF